MTEELSLDAYLSISQKKFEIYFEKGLNTLQNLIPQSFKMI